MREIEIKLKVNNLEALKQKFQEKECIFSEPIYQYDVIYSQKNSGSEFESSKEGDIILRIRRQIIGGNEVAEFNLKQQRSNEMDNIEYETEIENPEAVHNILNILGWVPQIEVKKNRQKGKFGEYEICIDEVEKIGSYIEIEKMVDDDADPDKTREKLFDVADFFGLSREDEEIRGYDTQIYLLNKNK